MKHKSQEITYIIHYFMRETLKRYLDDVGNASRF